MQLIPNYFKFCARIDNNNSMIMRKFDSRYEQMHDDSTVYCFENEMFVIFPLQIRYSNSQDTNFENY